jgi:hypothetical protein
MAKAGPKPVLTNTNLYRTEFISVQFVNLLGSRKTCVERSQYDRETILSIAGRKS